MKKIKQKKKVSSMGKYIWCLLMLTVCLCATACGSVWDRLWEREPSTDVDSDLLVIPGSGGPEDTMMIFDGAVNYTGDVHEGTDIYYVGNGPRRNRIIVIDAGHQAKGSSTLEPNGPNSQILKAEVTWGATGSHAGEEHALNLDVALLLRDELIARGYSVVMIRETADVNISNMERAKIANKYSAAAYIRIHANSYDDPEMQGAMTICQSANNPYPSCAALHEVSYLLSECVLDAYCENIGIEKLDVREMDNMTGTNWSEVPTTILEMGFLSNQQDDMLMATKFFKQKAATNMANGIDAFIDIVEVREENQTSDSEQTTTDSTSVDTMKPQVAETQRDEEPTVTDIETQPIDTDASEVTQEPVETDTSAVEETETIDVPADTFEGAVEYTGETHEGTDIYYIGHGGNKNHIIVIDAGHQLRGSSILEPNGPNSQEMKAEVTWGATGQYSGVEEHALNLDVALLLRDELVARGYSVVMIRETANVDISNMERAQIANKYGASAYIRIHANSYDDPEMQGAMTICQSANNPYPSCSAQYEASHALSTYILSKYCDSTGMKSLNVREMDNMTGTNWSEVPTTILEMGFMSNEADDMLMATQDFKENAAVGVANGVDAFIESLKQIENDA